MNSKIKKMKFVYSKKKKKKNSKNYFICLLDKVVKGMNAFYFTKELSI